MKNKINYIISVIVLLFLNACCKDKHTTLPVSFTGKLKYMTDSFVPQNQALHYSFTYDSTTGDLKTVYISELRKNIELKPALNNKIDIVYTDSTAINTVYHLTCYLTTNKRIQKITYSEPNGDTIIFRCVYKSNGKVDSIYETDLSFLQRNSLVFNFEDSSGNLVRNSNSDKYSYNNMLNDKYARFIYAPGYISSTLFNGGALSLNFLLGINGYYTLPPNKNLISNYKNNIGGNIDIEYTINPLNQISESKMSSITTDIVIYTKYEYY